MPAPQGFLAGLAQVFGGGLQGYAMDQKNHQVDADRDEARQNALMAKRATEEARAREDALKGIRQGTAPNQGMLTDAATLAQGFASPLAQVGIQGKMAETPEFFAPDRFQQVTPNSYLDRANTPEAMGQRKQEIAARLAEKGDAQRQAAAMAAQQAHEAFLQAQQERAQAAADRRAGAQKDHFTFITTTGPNGEQLVSRANTSTGDIEPTDAHAKASGKGPNGATSQLQQGRMLAAITEARMADERMRAFEDKLLTGQQSISPLAQAGGNLTSNLAGSHSVVGALVQSGSELGLNKSNPEYAQYLRDASTIGRAEQMIMPRGGTETMVRANSLLARAGTAAPKATIEASRMARQALFGSAGGLAQSMSPEQIHGIDEGVAKIKSGDHGQAPTGNVSLGKPTLPPLGVTDRARANSDPAFKAWLVQKGYHF